MTEGPIDNINSMNNELIPILHLTDIDSVLKTFNNYKLRRLVFFTVKDNSHSTRWDSIGKISDWVRRVSHHYMIVKGTQGGTHFHGLVGLSSDKTLSYQKGIHINVQYVNSVPKPDVPVDFVELKQGIDKQLYIIDTIFEDQTAALLDPFQQDKLRSICLAIKKYWLKIANKEKRQIKKSKKYYSIINIIKYLATNLKEKREEEIEEYVDYIFKY